MKLTDDRVEYDYEYDKEKPRAMLRYPLTVEEWKQILKNQELSELGKKLYYALDERNWVACGDVMKQLKKILEEKN